MRCLFHGDNCWLDGVDAKEDLHQDIEDWIFTQDLWEFIVFYYSPRTKKWKTLSVVPSPFGEYFETMEAEGFKLAQDRVPAPFDRYEVMVFRPEEGKITDKQFNRDIIIDRLCENIRELDRTGRTSWEALGFSPKTNPERYLVRMQESDSRDTPEETYFSDIDNALDLAKKGVELGYFMVNIHRYFARDELPPYGERMYHKGEIARYMIYSDPLGKYIPIPEEVAERLDRAGTPEEIERVIAEEESKLADVIGRDEYIDCDMAAHVMSQALRHKAIRHQTVQGKSDTGDTHQWIRVGDKNYDPTKQGYGSGEYEVVSEKGGMYLSEGERKS